jgi:hypothetical protein
MRLILNSGGYTMGEHKCINEERLRKLEVEGGIMNTRIDNLIKSLDSLTGWVKALVIGLIPTLVGAFGWLIVQVFLKK